MKITQTSEFMIFFDNLRVDEYVLSLNTYIGLGVEEAGGSVTLIRAKDLTAWKAYLTQVRIFAKNIFTQKYTMIFHGEIVGVNYDDRRSNSGNITYQFAGFYHWLMTPLSVNISKDDALKAYQNFLFEAQGINSDEMINLFHTESEQNLAKRNIKEIIEYLNERVYQTTFQSADSNFNFVKFTEKFRIFDDVDTVYRDDKFINFFSLVRSSQVGSYYEYLTRFLNELMFEFFQDRDGHFIVKNPGWTEPILKNHVIDESLVLGISGLREWVNEPTRVLAMGGTTAYYDQAMYNNPGAADYAKLLNIPTAIFIGTGLNPETDRWDFGKEGTQSGLATSEQEDIREFIDGEKWHDDVSGWSSDGLISSQMGNRTLSDGTSGYHNGIDIGGSRKVRSQGTYGELYFVQDPDYIGGTDGNAVNRSLSGVTWGGWGVAVIIKQNFGGTNYFFVYAHLEKSNAITLDLYQKFKNRGNNVITIEPGQLLGISSNTGSVENGAVHLHFEILKGDAKKEGPGTVWGNRVLVEPVSFFKNAKLETSQTPSSNKIVQLSANQSYLAYLAQLETENPFLTPIKTYIKNNLSDFTKKCDDAKIEYALGIPYLVFWHFNEYGGFTNPIATNQTVIGTYEKKGEGGKVWYKNSGSTYTDYDFVTYSKQIFEGTGGNSAATKIYNVDNNAFLPGVDKPSFNIQTHVTTLQGIKSQDQVIKNTDQAFYNAIFATENRYATQIMPFQIAKEPSLPVWTDLINASKGTTAADKTTVMNAVREHTRTWFVLTQQISVCLLNDGSTYTPFVSINQVNAPTVTPTDNNLGTGNLSEDNETKTTYKSVNYTTDDSFVFEFSSINEAMKTETKNAIKKAIEAVGEENNVSPNLIAAIIEESRVPGDDNLKTDTVKQATQHYGISAIPIEYLDVAKQKDTNITDSNQYDLEINILLGVRYLTDLLTKFDGSVSKALMAYYIGEMPGRVDTRNYVQEAIEMYAEANPTETDLDQKKNYFGNVVTNLVELIPSEYRTASNVPLDIFSRKTEVERFVTNVIELYVGAKNADYILGDPHTEQYFEEYGANVDNTNTINTGGNLRLSAEERKYKMNLKIVEKALIRYDIVESKKSVTVIRDENDVNELILKFAKYMMLLHRGKANSMTVQLTTCLPFIRPGMNIWLEPSRTDVIGYVTGVSHEGSHQTGMTTTLRVEFVRKPESYKDGLDANLFLGANVGSPVDASSQYGSVVSSFSSIRSTLKALHKLPEEMVDDAQLISQLSSLYASGNKAGKDFYGQPLSQWNLEYEGKTIPGLVSSEVSSVINSIISERIGEMKSAFSKAKTFYGTKLFGDETR